jgi:RNA polymerase sigma-70 factor (ECF subfamily)
MSDTEVAMFQSVQTLTRRPDASLLASARDDPRAFRELYDRYASRIYAFQLSRTRDDHAAHDLTAETFAQVWVSRARFRDEADGSAAPWLFGIARNVLLASVRRGRLERDACERLGIVAELDRPEIQPDETWVDGLDEALAALPQSQREAIELRVVDDLDYSGIAERLGTTPPAARVRVHRGLAALRIRLSNSKETP